MYLNKQITGKHFPHQITPLIPHMSKSIILHKEICTQNRFGCKGNQYVAPRTNNAEQKSDNLLIESNS